MSFSKSQNQVVVFLLYLLNLLFACLGLALTGVLLVLFIMPEPSGSSVQQPAALSSDFIFWSFVVLGIVIAFTALLGCCGLLYKHKIVMIVYSVIMLIEFIAHLVLIIVFYSGSDSGAGRVSSLFEQFRQLIPGIDLLSILLIGLLVIEFVIVVLSCVIIGSQKRTKNGFYAGRVPQKFLEQQRRMHELENQQNQNPYGWQFNNSGERIYNDDGSLYTGPLATDQQEYVEFEYVRQEESTPDNIQVGKNGEIIEYVDSADNDADGGGREYEIDVYDNSNLHSLPGQAQLDPSLSFLSLNENSLSEQNFSDSNNGIHQNSSSSNGPYIHRYSDNELPFYPPGDENTVISGADSKAAISEAIPHLPDISDPEADIAPRKNSNDSRGPKIYGRSQWSTR